MKKFILIVVLLCLVMLMFTGCKTNVETDNDKTIFDKFTVIETRTDVGDGTLYIMYDNDTKVEYYYIYTAYRGGICPVYNADGTVKVYSENSNE